MILNKLEAKHLLNKPKEAETLVSASIRYILFIKIKSDKLQDAYRFGYV